MDTKNWFGEHAGTVKTFALIGAIVLAGIVVFDILAQRGKAQAAAAGVTAPTSANGSATDAATGTSTPGGTLGNGYTDINVFQDYSTHNSSDVTSNQYTPPSAGVGAYPGGSPSGPPHTLIGSAPSAPFGGLYNGTGLPTSTVNTSPSAPTSTGGATVPVPTPHPSSQYTVQPGDSLWSIAANHLGGGYNWTELYNWNRSVVGSNPNLIYPGEVLTLN